MLTPRISTGNSCGAVGSDVDVIVAEDVVVAMLVDVVVEVSLVELVVVDVLGGSVVVTGGVQVIFLTVGEASINQLHISNMNGHSESSSS